jgi:glutamine synthetase
MSIEHVNKLIKDHAIEWVDLRFADMRGVQHHVTFPVDIVEPRLFEDGKMFDGSSISGWKGINESDMILLPDASTAVVDPFTADPTLILVCDILDPQTMQAYSRDPRGVAKRAEAYLKSSGIADQAFFGPEPEFFIFDSVRFANDMGHTFFEVDSEEAHWNSKKKYEGGNTGYRPGLKGGYFPVAPVDSLHDIRAEMCKELMAAGQVVEVHHHEVANAGQCEIGTKFNTLVQKADELMMMKYIIKNVAHRNGKTATFMPKPLVGDNGSGMHVHQSLAKGGAEPVLRRRLRRPVADRAVVHRRHLQARARDQRLRQLDHQQLQAPGAGLRGAGDAGLLGAQPLRPPAAFPYVSNPKGRRIEIRFPDPMNSGYLIFAALMMAGLDGIKNQIDPGAPSDKDLYDLPPEEEKNIPKVCHSLDMALEALDGDREFLKAGGVFTDDFIDSYIELKMGEVTKFRAATHPLEYQMYYGI